MDVARNTFREAAQTEVRVGTEDPSTLLVTLTSTRCSRSVIVGSFAQNREEMARVGGRAVREERMLCWMCRPGP